MFRTLALVILLFSALHAFGQKSDLDLVKEFMAFQKSHNDSLTRETYMDAAFCSKFNLKEDSWNYRRMATWVNPAGHGSKDFIKVCDIRWRFKDNKEALAFHKKFLGVNSDYGEEIEMHNLELQHAQDFHVFRENVGARQMSADFGYPVSTYYFLFVMDNHVAKVLVNTKTSVTVDQAFVFAKEAARKLHIGTSK